MAVHGGSMPYAPPPPPPPHVGVTGVGVTHGYAYSSVAGGPAPPPPPPAAAPLALPPYPERAPPLVATSAAPPVPPVAAPPLVRYVDLDGGLKHTPSAEPKGSLVARLKSYQRELYDTARDRNTVVFSPTGSGKTWVAAAVVQQVLQRSPRTRYVVPEQRRSKLRGGEGYLRAKNFIAFVVNRIPLVEQQAAALTAAFKSVGEEIRVLRVSSEHGSFDSSGGSWATMYHHYDIIVIIDVILLGQLDKNVAAVSDFDLIVVDECHHVTKDAPMNRIFDYVKGMKGADQVHRPQVMGLTASPGAGETFNATLTRTQDVLKNMTCGITTVLQPENKAELKRTVTPAVQTMVPYRINQLEVQAVALTESVADNMEDLIRNHCLDHGLDGWKKYDSINPAGRAAAEYQGYCSGEAQAAEAKARFGVAHAYHFLKLLAETMLYFIEVGFEDALKELDEQYRYLLASNRPPIPEQEQHLISCVGHAYAYVRDKLDRLRDAHPEASTGTGSKLTELFNCLRRAVAAYNFQGTWVRANADPAAHDPLRIIAITTHSPTQYNLAFHTAPAVDTHGADADSVHVPATMELHYNPTAPALASAPTPAGPAEPSEPMAILRGRCAGVGGLELTCGWVDGGQLYLNVSMHGVAHQLVYRRCATEATVGVAGSGHSQQETLQFRGIVFTQTKRGVNRIAEQLVARRLGGVRPGCFVGHGRSGIDKGMDNRKQTRALQDFRSGNYNLLVATNVAEEGIDIPICNVVVRYDTHYSVISLVQSRGRARARNSMFLVVVNETEMDRYLQLKEQERLQQMVVEHLALHAQQGQGGHDSDSDEDLEAAKSNKRLERLAELYLQKYFDPKPLKFSFETTPLCASGEECVLVCEVDGEWVRKTAAVDGGSERMRRRAKQAVAKQMCYELRRRGKISEKDVLDVMRQPITSVQISPVLRLTSIHETPPDESQVTSYVREDWGKETPYAVLFRKVAPLELTWPKQGATAVRARLVLAGTEYVSREIQIRGDAPLDLLRTLLLNTLHNFCIGVLRQHLKLHILRRDTQTPRLDGLPTPPDVNAATQLMHAAPVAPAAPHVASGVPPAGYQHAPVPLPPPTHHPAPPLATGHPAPTPHHTHLANGYTVAAAPAAASYPLYTASHVPSSAPSGNGYTYASATPASSAACVAAPPAAVGNGEQRSGYTPVPYGQRCPAVPPSSAHGTQVGGGSSTAVRGYAPAAAHADQSHSGGAAPPGSSFHVGAGQAPAAAPVDRHMGTGPAVVSYMPVSAPSGGGPGGPLGAEAYHHHTHAPPAMGEASYSSAWTHGAHQVPFEVAPHMPVPAHSQPGNGYVPAPAPSHQQLSLAGFGVPDTAPAAPTFHSHAAPVPVVNGVPPARPHAPMGNGVPWAHIGYAHPPAAAAAAAGTGAGAAQVPVAPH